MPAPRLSRPGLWPGRSVVLARGGMVCTSQPLASAAALDILRRGGNAIDAAICASATLGVVEPLSTGIGGDMFAIYWSAKEKRLKGLNGSGRCPANLSWRTFARRGIQAVPSFGWGAATVPGCVDGWATLHAADGKLPWSFLFNAAIDYARDGFPLTEVIAGEMSRVGPRLQNDAAKAIYTPEGKPVEPGQWFKNPDLAASYQAIASGGAEAYYKGEIAEKIVKAAEASEGFFTKEDFVTHSSLWQDPVKATFRGVDVYELPPNGQGIAVLIALNILQSLDLEKLSDDWTALTHAAIEAIKLAYAERAAHIADPSTNPAPLNELLSLTFATHAGMTIDPQRAIPRESSLVGTRDGGTVYLCTADADGNVVSLISSLYQGGCGIVPDGTGIMLHNRGAGFTLEGGHPNQMAPKKRPFHTIIPGVAVRHGQPYLAFGVMGGHHQAQGHVQVLINLLLHGMNLQEAVSAPRFDFRTENFVALEADFPPDIAEALQQKGHKIVENDVGPFGGGQLLRVRSDGVYEGASDTRKDGCAIGF